MKLSFLKMHGLGNDFVVIDARENGFNPDKSFLCAVANRKRGIGCDGIVLMRKPLSPEADIFLEMYNSDGSSLRACGNASRCIASLMFTELGKPKCVIETVAGLLHCWEESSGVIAVDFGAPLLEWNEIPLAREVDTLHAPIASGGLFAPCCVNMGNPHTVYFVEDVEAVALAEVGPILENDPIFPDRCNIEIAQIVAPDRIRMRVWERGAGITDACGSGACATLVAAVRRGKSARLATVVLDGGELMIEWRADTHVVMMGGASLSYRGEITDDFGSAQ
jgi:diaminopimelate epimerase